MKKTVASLLLLFSMSVSLIGMTAPFLDAPDAYGPTAAIHQLLHPVPPPLERAALAARN